MRSNCVIYKREFCLFIEKAGTWDRLWKAEEGVLGRVGVGRVFDADGGGLCGVSAFRFVLSLSTPRLRSTQE